jgi:hypothetical protein
MMDYVLSMAKSSWITCSGYGKIVFNEQRYNTCTSRLSYPAMRGSVLLIDIVQVEYRRVAARALRYRWNAIGVMIRKPESIAENVDARWTR